MPGRHAAPHPPLGKFRVAVISGIFTLAGTYATVLVAVNVEAVRQSKAVRVATDAGATWVLDVDPGLELAGLTGPASLAIEEHTAPRIEAPTPGLDAPVPLDFDFVEAHRRAVIEHQNAADLEASADQRTRDWMAARGLNDPGPPHPLLCDESTPPTLRPVCK